MTDSSMNTEEDAIPMVMVLLRSVNLFLMKLYSMYNSTVIFIVPFNTSTVLLSDIIFFIPSRGFSLLNLGTRLSVENISLVWASVTITPVIIAMSMRGIAALANVIIDPTAI